MGILKDIKVVARGWRWTHRPLVPASVAGQGGGPREFETDWARTPAGRAARAAILRYGFSPLLASELDLKVHGRQILDGLKPPVIFVSNHASHLDAPVLLTSLPPKWRRRTAVGAATDYFFDVWWRRAVTTLVFNAFPIERRGTRRSARKARDLLGEGWSLVVFPEGTRSRDGWVGTMRSGAAWLAAETGVPVVPIGLSGTYQAMPPGRGWPKPGRPSVSVRFGEGLRAQPGERVAAFQERIRLGLAATLDEDRTTWWEASRRAASGTSPDPGGPEAPRWRRLWESSRPLPSNRSSRAWP